MAFWNANGIIPKRNELEEFIHRQELDLIAVNETHLNPCNQLNLANFYTYRNDRDGEGGGTAIIIRRNIQHYEEGKMEGMHHLEANSIMLQPKKWQKHKNRVDLWKAR